MARGQSLTYGNYSDSLPERPTARPRESGGLKTTMDKHEQFSSVIPAKAGIQHIHRDHTPGFPLSRE